MEDFFFNQSCVLNHPRVKILTSPFCKISFLNINKYIINKTGHLNATVKNAEVNSKVETLPSNATDFTCCIEFTNESSTNKSSTRKSTKQINIQIDWYLVYSWTISVPPAGGDFMITGCCKYLKLQFFFNGSCMGQNLLAPRDLFTFRVLVTWL